MLWGAFNNASTAMRAMTVDLGSISQNIANVNTTGYKTSEMMFSTVLSEGHASPNAGSGGLNIFGVKASQRNHIEVQGMIQSSGNWSDLAINGQGFFMVAPSVGNAAPTSPSLTDPRSVLYTRDGSFHRAIGEDTDPDLARNYFVTGAGGYLMGWMADETGAIPSDATLQPVYTLLPKPIANNGTAAVDSTATVTASSQVMPGRTTTTASIMANIPRNSAIGGNESTVTVNDALGNPQTVTLNWARTGADTWTVTPTSDYATGFSVPSWTVTQNSAGEVTSPVGPQALSITWDAAHGGAAAAATIDPSAAPVSRGALQKVSVEVFDSNYQAHTVTLGFERTGTNSWYMITDPGADATTVPPPVAVTFDSNGRLTSPTGDVTGTVSWTYDMGSPPVASTGTATVALDLSKISQFDNDSVYLGNITQDGYARGTLMGTSFTSAGELQGYYDNGRSLTLFKVPVANFVAQNALAPVSGNLFRRTAEAGDVTVSSIEDVPGDSQFATSSLEISGTEIETEFTRMIMTQKAYSTNAQVFKTADEMTMAARDLLA